MTYYFMYQMFIRGFTLKVLPSITCAVSLLSWTPFLLRDLLSLCNFGVWLGPLTSKLSSSCSESVCCSSFLNFRRTLTHGTTGNFHLQWLIFENRKNLELSLQLLRRSSSLGFLVITYLVSFHSSFISIVRESKLFIAPYHGWYSFLNSMSNRRQKFYLILRCIFSFWQCI